MVVRLDPNAIGFVAAAIIGAIFGFSLASITGAEGKDWIGFAGSALGAVITAAVSIGGAWWLSYRETWLRRRAAAHLYFDEISEIRRNVLRLLCIMEKVVAEGSRGHPENFWAAREFYRTEIREHLDRLRNNSSNDLPDVTRYIDDLRNYIEEWILLLEESCPFEEASERVSFIRHSMGRAYNTFLQLYR